MGAGENTADVAAVREDCDRHAMRLRGDVMHGQYFGSFTLSGYRAIRHIMLTVVLCPVF